MGLGLSSFQRTYGGSPSPLPSTPAQYRPGPGEYDPALDPNRHMIPGEGAAIATPPQFPRISRRRIRRADSPLPRHSAAKDDANDDDDDSSPFSRISYQRSVSVWAIVGSSLRISAMISLTVWWI